jgi:hypothetical protein
MPLWVNLALVVFLILAALLAAVDFAYNRSWRRLIFHLVTLGIVFLILWITTGFPSPTRQAFGGISPLLALALMYAGVVLGIAANYIFYLSQPFSWLDFARPLVVSPIVLLPLIGSLQGARLESLQIVCFVVLAFQNGFFWQQVLRNAKPKRAAA